MKLTAKRRFVLIFETGDDVMGGAQSFAREQRLAGSHFTAIGAFKVRRWAISIGEKGLPANPRE